MVNEDASVLGIFLADLIELVRLVWKQLLPESRDAVLDVLEEIERSVTAQKLRLNEQNMLVRAVQSSRQKTKDLRSQLLLVHREYQDLERSIGDMNTEHEYRRVEMERKAQVDRALQIMEATVTLAAHQGECSPIRGSSAQRSTDVEDSLQTLVHGPTSGLRALQTLTEELTQFGT
eukprot:Clim_evm19s12 gene=Clim_evmTU19s12